MDREAHDRQSTSERSIQRMDGKQRQYVPPALGGSTVSSRAAAAAQKRFDLGKHARPPLPSSSLPQAHSSSAQTLSSREQATADIRRHMPQSDLDTTTASPGTLALLRASRDAVRGTGADVAAGHPPRSHNVPAPTSPVSAAAAAAAAASAAAAAAVLHRIRSHGGGTPGHGTSGSASLTDVLARAAFPPDSDASFAHRAMQAGTAAPPQQPTLSPTLPLRRPPSSVAAPSVPAAEAELHQSHLATPTPPPPPLSSLQQLQQNSTTDGATQQVRDNLDTELLHIISECGAPNASVGHVDAKPEMPRRNLTTVTSTHVGLKRPRGLASASPVDTDYAHTSRTDMAPLSPSSTSSSDSSASLSSGHVYGSSPVDAGSPASTPLSPLRTIDGCVGAPLPSSTDSSVGAKRERRETLATRPTAAPPNSPAASGTAVAEAGPRTTSGLVPRTVDASVTAAPSQVRADTAVLRSAVAHVLDTGSSDGGDQEETEEDDDDSDAECRGRRSVVRSDPLRVVVDLAQIAKVVAAATAPSPSTGTAAVGQAKTGPAEPLLDGREDEDEECSGVRRSRASVADTEHDELRLTRIRAELEQQQRARDQRRAAVAATVPTPPAELLLDLLAHLPGAPRRAVYDRDSCPASAAVAGFGEDFHSSVQQLMTRVVLQRDGRTGYSTPHTPCRQELDPQQQNATKLRGGKRSGGLRKVSPTTAQKDEEEETSAVLGGARRIDADVRDAVAYARAVLQARLQQEQLSKPQRRSSPGKGTVEATTGDSASVEEGGTDTLTLEHRQQLAELRAVVVEKLHRMQVIPVTAAAAAAVAPPAAAAVASDTVETSPPGTQATAADETSSSGARLAAHPAGQSLAAAHAHFMAVVRHASAGRREKLEAAQQAEQELEAAVAAWRAAYDVLLGREDRRQPVRPAIPHAEEMSPRPDKRARTEALLQRLQGTRRHAQEPQPPPQAPPQDPRAALWELTRGMRKKDRRRLQQLAHAAAGAFPMPPFSFPR